MFTEQLLTIGPDILCQMTNLYCYFHYLWDLNINNS